MRCQPIFVRFLSPNKINPTMGKSIHFSGQPLYGQVIKLLDKSTILRFSRKHGGEHYIKRFDCWTHLVVMLYAVIMRFDSLREITASLQAEARKLFHLGISSMPSRSTLSDANQRRPEVIFESIYRDLYATYRHVLSSDSRKKQGCCLDEASPDYRLHYYHTVLQSAVQGRGPSSQNRQQERGIKVHTVIHANEGVPSDIKFTSAATNDSFYVKAVNIEQRRHSCHGPGIY